MLVGQTIQSSWIAPGTGRRHQDHLSQYLSFFGTQTYKRSERKNSIWRSSVHMDEVTGLRAVLANRIASSGAEWVATCAEIGRKQPSTRLLSASHM